MINDDLGRDPSLREPIVANFEAISIVGIKYSVEPMNFDKKFPLGEEGEDGGFANTSISNNEDSIVEFFIHGDGLNP